MNISREDRLTNEQLIARISVNPEVCGGQPCVADTRIPIWVVLGALADGLSVDEVIAYYPNLKTNDILAVLLYAASRFLETPE